MHRWLPTLLLLALLAGFRVLGSAFPETLPNFQPLPALLLCSVIYLNGARRWLVPMGVWLVTDPAASLFQGHPLFGWHHAGIFVGLAATVAIALGMHRHRSAAKTLIASGFAAVAFYLAANTVAFMTDALYPKNLEGFFQAQWTGPVGFAPTWVFLRNLLAANLLFTGLFMLARLSVPKASAKPVEAFSR
jgi:hypothetical protein